IYTFAVERPASQKMAAGNIFIYQLDGSQALPDHLKLQGPAVSLPRIVEVRRLKLEEKQFASAVFTFDSQQFWISHDDRTLSLWAERGAVKKGSYQTPGRLVLLAVDRQGRLWAQQDKGRAGPGKKKKAAGPGGKRAVGDLSIWENLVPTGEN